MSARQASVWFGGVFIALGLGIAVMVHAAPQAATVPLLVLDAVAGAFFFAGASVVARGFGMELAARLCALVMLYLFAVPGLWLFLGDDVATCTVSGTLAGAPLRGEGNELLCRSLVGIGSLLTLAAVGLFTAGFVRWLRRPRG
jgi:hypothetical protein